MAVTLMANHIFTRMYEKRFESLSHMYLINIPHFHSIAI
ncbi:hypothetical protein COLO4_00286 [Corchorus olitorius]|uniref:Uncharacterized protein n=1 Tax=Corchorus olitorius TaxID=93759 RepID=A0A1R3L442_9ROSI|nr:hypothetical protein COLO4_03761 [Corchorus olitorius]OMP14115.1 hypothetical protein COLO4_00286 [Corchorus olitorius]